MSSKILCHRGFWKGLPLLQNTNEAVKDAFLGGFDVELDIRLDTRGMVGTGHDIAQEFNWEELFTDRNKKMVAFHIKEENMASTLFSLINFYSNLEYIIFGVPEKERKTYEGLFGLEHVAFEYNAGDDFERAYDCRNKVIWIAELEGKKCNKNEFLLLQQQGKKVYLVMQDCHEGDVILFGLRLAQYYKGLFEGICLDSPNIINEYRTV